MARLEAIIRGFLGRLCNELGLELIGRQKLPRNSLLGLRQYDFRVIVDVGANEGQFANTISQKFPKAQLYCFEPLPAAFQLLRTWAESTHENKIIAFNMALGDKDGTVEMFYHTEHSPSSSLLSTTSTTETLYPVTKQQESISVPLKTLDHALLEYLDEIPEGILIKMDVQGYEDRVIRGGRKVFAKARAVILEVCLDSLYEQQAKFSDIVRLMDEYGFHYKGNLEQVYGDDGRVIFLDAVFDRE